MFGEHGVLGGGVETITDSGDVLWVPVSHLPLFLQSVFPNLSREEGAILVGAAPRLFPPTQLPLSYQE